MSGSEGLSGLGSEGQEHQFLSSILDEFRAIQTFLTLENKLSLLDGNNCYERGNVDKRRQHSPLQPPTRISAEPAKQLYRNWDAGLWSQTNWTDTGETEQPQLKSRRMQKL